eukprot:5332529-Amphidinium_carterae.1
MNLTRRDCPLKNDGQHLRNPEGHSRDHHERGPSRTEKTLHHAKRPSISLGSLELAAACLESELGAAHPPYVPIARRFRPRCIPRSLWHH